MLIQRYYELRAETQNLQNELQQSSKQFIQHPRISQITSLIPTKTSEWNIILARQQFPPQKEQITVSQLESALQAKWKSKANFYPLLNDYFCFLFL